MKNILFFLFFLSTSLAAQNSLTGVFSALGNQTVRLVGFDGFGIYTIDSIKSSANGAFSLSYSEKDYGMAYLATNDNKSFIVVLGDEKMHVSGETFAMPETIRVKNSPENELFGRYASEHPRREQALSAWDYLEKIYRMDSLFSVQNRPKKEIERERNRIKEEDRKFLASLDAKTYTSWYLPVRKLVSTVGTIAQYRTEEIPATFEAFRAMNYTDRRLYKSGLLREAIEAHFWLIENSGRPLDSVFVEMNISIDRILPALVADEKKFNEITDYLFKLFEKRSLFGASEYLALKVLNEQSCTLNNDLAAQMESYRAMKKGNMAPDILFEGEVLLPVTAASIKSDSQSSLNNSTTPGIARLSESAAVSGEMKTHPNTAAVTGDINTYTKLSDLRSRYTVVVFGASWCAACQTELAQIAELYPNWKKQGVEVVFVSLDDKPEDFRTYAKKLPFISLCDFKKWESPVAKAYHVFATPTLYLLDANRTIILRPNSARQLDSWVDWFLVQGNI